MLTGPQVASLVDTARAGAMAAAASEDDINTVMDIVGVSKDQAALLLRKNNNDLSQAVSAYFDDPNGALREDPAARQWEHADNIPYDDAVHSNLPPLSRPPSRTDGNNKGVIDLTTNHAAAHPRTQQDHDEDLQKAIELSKQEAYGDQENGITYTGGHFGPANRSHYDPNQWAIAPYSSAREITEHPPPQQRQRNPGEPAFLRGQTSTGYLGPLLTIYHNIPLAREAMLFPPMGVLAYGYDPNWWSGHNDENTKSLSVLNPERSDRDAHNLLAEIQCLMAFLDDSKRAYASADALADLHAYKASGARTEVSKLLNSWKHAVMRQGPDEPLTQIFSLEAKKKYDGNSQPYEKTLNCLEPYVQRAECPLLVELLDKTIWNDNSDAVDDIWIEHISEVLTIHLSDPKREKLPLGVAPPTTLYPDRYLYEFREQSQQIRREIQVLRRRIDKHSKVQQNCEVVQSPDRRLLKVKEVLLAAVDAIPVVAASNSQTDNASFIEETNTATSVSQSSMQKLDSDLRDMLLKLDQQMDRLEAKKVEIKEQMRKLTLQLTQPNPNPFEPSPKHKYMLQGVSTKPDITYVRRKNLDLIDIDSDEGDSLPDWQWWRMSWSRDEVGGSTAIGPLPEHQSNTIPHSNGTDLTYNVRKVKEEEVLEAAQTEHNSVLLVYASEQAMSVTPSPLSMALRKLIEQDNRTFDNELRDAGIGQYSVVQQNDLSSLDDLNPSTHVQEIRELTPMSTTSPTRDADGQPSPKRPKSSEEWSNDSPPAYDEVISSPVEMMDKEKNKGKIGMYAEQMLEKYGGDGVEKGG